MSKSDRQYIELSLGKIGISLGIQVKIEDEGVVVDVFDEDDNCVETTHKLWEDIVSDEWGLTLLELLNKQHNPEFIEE